MQHTKRQGFKALGGALGLTALGVGLSGLGASNPASAQAAANAGMLDRIKQRGSVTVAIYKDNPPFCLAPSNSEGIDIAIAQALAEKLGVKLQVLGFDADENMNDDLRNMVWRGHYLGHGPADFMMHVPVDEPLMTATPQALIFAPFYRETVVIARDIRAIPDMPDMRILENKKIAVAGQSLAGWLMIGAENGVLRPHLTTKLKDGTEAAALLKKGDVLAAAGNRSELEHVLGNDSRFAIDSLPMPRAPKNGWAIGLAVRKPATELARALQQGMNELADGGELRTIFGKYGVNWRKA